MLVTVSDIPITGKYYEFNLDSIDRSDMKLTEPVHFKGTMYKSGDDVRLDASLETHLEVNCDRCLEPFIFHLHADFELFYQPLMANQKAEEELTMEELGILHYQENTIDLSEAIRDTIIIEMPMQRLCKEDCQGLCIQCGQNLNLDQCNCKKRREKPNPFQEFFQKHHA
jgi:uncharacterized protein